MQRILTLIRAPARPTLIFGGVTGFLFAFAILLWIRFGSTIFFEVMRNGLSACLG